ncbi:MAG TPA: ShlB/FhaC/HecB family hemolysin secretion/activation protein [Candidatus Omnitrophota bacterium]|nr:ShlB/FhaC/HecB family hemolysin secretion/activation protein [Candidatus Omnitrophota bacterium]
MFRTIKFFCLITGIVLVSATSVFSQQIDSERATRDLVTQTDLLKQNEDRFLKTSQEPVIEEEEKEEKPKKDEGPVFLVKKIVIEGSTLIPEQEVHALAQPFEDKKNSFGDLERLADLVTAYYRHYGYTTTKAYIPPQKVKDGIVTIQVMEGRVGKVDVEGNRWFKKKVYLGGIALAAGDFFEMSELEGALRSINLEPDRAVKAYLEPGEETGTTNITLKAKDKFPVHLSYEFNLRGTKLTHRARHMAHLTHNNLLGFGDSLQANFTLAEQGAIVGSAAYYEFPILRTGTIFSLAASVAQSRLQKSLREFDVQGKSWSVIPGVTQNFIRTDRFYLDGALRFEVKDSRTLISDQQLSFDRSRAVVIGPRAGYYDKWGQTFGAADLHVGIPHFMGGSSKYDGAASRLDSGGQFVYGTANVARLQRLPYQSILVMQASGQYSPSPLNSLEQMNMGGMFSIRGYPENDSSGDSGYSFSTELRVPPYFIPHSWNVPGMKNKKMRDAFSLVGFIEGGQVFNYKRQNAGSETTKTLAGTGFGARFYVSPDFNIQFDYGIPLGDPSSDKNRNQIHLSARVGF